MKGTSLRAKVGPKLSAAVWMVRRNGEAKTVSTFSWCGKAALRARHCSLPFAVKTASAIVKSCCAMVRSCLVCLSGRPHRYIMFTLGMTNEVHFGRHV